MGWIGRWSRLITEFLPAHHTLHPHFCLNFRDQKQFIVPKQNDVVIVSAHLHDTIGGRIDKRRPRSK